MIALKQVTEITIVDPDTQLPVEVTIYKMDTGAMVGIDSSFLMNTDDPIYSPYDGGFTMSEIE